LSILAVERFPKGLHGYEEERREEGREKSWWKLSGKADQPRVEDEGTRGARARARAREQ
jgi:hypothetical protein